MSKLMALALLATFTILPMSMCAQGSLTPPGAPAPAMKTLSQIEARTPVDATNTPGNASQQFSITQPGSYYLTGNIIGVSGKYGIGIQTNDVTLDLNGFEMLGASNSLYGIEIGAGQNIVIRNGTLRNWSIGVQGLNYCELEHLQVYGSVSLGFYLTDHCAVRSCSAVNNGYAGISVGSFCQITDCLVSSNASAGIISGNTCNLKACTVSANINTGISIGNGCAVADCLVLSNATGISGGSNCFISGCQADYNTNTGINLTDNFNISRSRANDDGVNGFNLGNNGLLSDCTATGDGFAFTFNFNYVQGGFNVGSGSEINKCVANADNEYGIQVVDNCGVIACNASDNGSGGNGADGILVWGDNCQIINNTCNGNAYCGIEVYGIQNRIDNNSVGNNLCGIAISQSNVGNCITRNSAPGNSSGGYSTITGNPDLAPIQTPTTATSPWANF